MVKINKLLVLMGLFLNSFVSFGQEKIEINDIVREWKLDFLEQNGKQRSAEESEKDESITFYRNNKFKLKDYNDTTQGIWHYNYLTGMIELDLIELGQKLKIKIVSLSKTELVSIYEDIDKKLIYHFK